MFFSPCASCGSCCSRMFTFFAATLLLSSVLLLVKEQTHAMNWKMRVYIMYASSLSNCFLASHPHPFLFLIPSFITCHPHRIIIAYCHVSLVIRLFRSIMCTESTLSPFPDLTSQLLLVNPLFPVSCVIYLFLL